jgi:outer membrane lipoprotein-sorting protein
MSVLSRHPMLRWVLPVLAAVVLAAGGSAVGSITAAARSGLPHRTAAQLLVDVQRARLDGLSGTIVQNSDLGLPALPGVGGTGSSDLTSLVSGSHTLRLWYAGPDRFRVALLGSLGESDVVRDGKDLWTWSSKGRSAEHRVVPVESAPQGLESVSPVTPQRAAETALRAISPTTEVTTDGTAVVAGRSAYELVLHPRAHASLVGSVSIAIDGRSHVPTRVQVFARNGSKPAFEVGFTSFDPTRPPASVFRFNPPPGTKVTESSSTGVPHRSHTPGNGPKPTVVGSAWTSVVVARVPHAARAVPPSLRRVLQTLPTVSGTWGSGHVLSGTLFSAVLTDDGRVAVGAVRPQRLYAALDHG